jgi:hypothetical protein
LTREALKHDALSLIARLGAHGIDPEARDALLVRMLRWQATAVAPYRRLARGVDPSSLHVSDWPAMPTDVFRFTRVAAHASADDVRRFHTSGTTSGTRGQHAFRDFSLYHAASRALGRRVLFPTTEPVRVVSLVADETEVDDSSLSHMCSRYAEWFGDGHTVWGWRTGALDMATITSGLDAAVAEGIPVVVLSTSFALMFLDEALSDQRWRLPSGSRVMYTGGFKGRTREISPAELIQRISHRLGVPESAFWGEYGMTELSSQAWSTGEFDDAGRAVYGTPGWVRVSTVAPDTLKPALPGDVGLLRIDDAANLDSVAAIVTGDLARCLDPQRFVLLGRQPGAVARGCSLAIEEALG